MTAEQPRWRGVNHLALITNDMDATVRFYHGVLGARLVATIGTPGFRHYFFEFGPEQTVAFFEYRGIELEQWAKPAGIPDPRATQFDHLSFNLPDEHALESFARTAGSNVSTAQSICPFEKSPPRSPATQNFAPSSFTPPECPLLTLKALLKRQKCCAAPPCAEWPSWLPCAAGFALK